MSEKILSLEELRGRVSKFYTAKSAAHDPVPEKDPNIVPVPSDSGYYNTDGDDAGKVGVPAAGLTNDNLGEAKNIIPGGDTGEASGGSPTGAGESGISVPADGKEKDESATSGKNPSEVKIAKQAQSLASGIRDRILKQATGTAAVEAPEAPEAKTAAEEVASDFAEDPDAYHKIASLVMQYEEGRELVNELADRELGKQAAIELIEQAEELEKQAAYEQEAYEQSAYVFDELMKNASTEDVEQIQKIASVHGAKVDNYAYDFEKFAYDAGAEQAAGALDQPDEEIPGDIGGEVSLDEIAEVILEMVEGGEIPPEVGEQVLQELASEDAGGGEAVMEGELPPEAMEAMGPVGAEELGKVASIVAGIDQPSEVEALRAENARLKADASK